MYSNEDCRRFCTIRGVGSSTPEVLAPVWVVVSQSIHAYSTSSVPLAGTSRFQRMAIYTGCLRCAGAPRRPTTGSALSLFVPHRHVLRPRESSSLRPPTCTWRILTSVFGPIKLTSCPADLFESLTSRTPQSTDSRAICDGIAFRSIGWGR